MTNEQRAILDAANIIVQQQISKIQYNYYINGVVKSAGTTANTYNVQCNDIIYNNVPSKNGLIYQVDDAVQILIKNGDLKQKFIDDTLSHNYAQLVNTLGGTASTKLAFGNHTHNISTGGTGLTASANGAYYNTGTGSTAMSCGTLPIAQGGTGKTTATEALSNLGGLPILGGFTAGETTSATRYIFNSSNGSDGITQVNSGSGESSIGFKTAGTLYWVLGKGCGGTNNDFALWNGQNSGVKFSVSQTGLVYAVNHIQHGNTSVQNVYAKFIAASNGNYFGFHATGDGFYLHKQNSSDGVLGTLLSIDSSNNITFGQSGALNLLSNNHGIRVNYNGGSPVVVPYANGAGANNTIDLGSGDYRYKNIYLNNNPNVYSDERVKRDIIEIDNSIATDFINSFKVVSYNYNYDDETEKKRIGVIAQRLVESNADFSKYFIDDDGSDNHYLSMRPTDLVFPLIQTVQFYKTEIDDLKSQLQSQQQQIDELKSLIKG